ncbi:PepSY-associated TM helix domain-containing protein [Tautonia plasticadhaerens]|uniref:PepSY-associated TM helix n=1 Tax=Tautonia plasticadhaerens TaxID=2527974 RepID=A0A518GV11_9BACT|nr:PepSY-associated TM helix domain-containing protein [Tautonia plasticadhaerens]QDV32418.1 hypothetical protein ElP_02500 [Tautonia plasticadhaerens]
MLKLSREAHRMLWDVHGVAGVLSSLVLFVAFFAGTLTVFHGAIEAWELPSLRGEGAGAEPESIDALIAPFLDEHRPEVPRAAGDGDAPPPTARLMVSMPGADRPRLGVWTVQYAGEARLNEHEALIDVGDGGPVAAGSSTVADLIYGLHYHLAVPFEYGGRYVYWAFGLVAVVGLLVVVSGLVFHLRLLALQFFQFRPRANARTLWTDAHKVLGVLGLPYWLMYLLTGAWFPLAGLLVALLGLTAFRDSEVGARELIFPSARFQRKAAGEPAPMLGFDAIRERAREAWPGLEVEAYDVLNYGDSNAYCRVRGSLGGGFLHRAVLFLDPVTGAELGRQDPSALGFAEGVQQAVVGLHFADFGGVALRWCYFVLGVGGCLCIASGTMVWAELRRRGGDRPRPLGTDRWLAPATAGVMLGLCSATAGLFVASKAIPPDAADRPWWVQLAFWSTWGLTALYGASRRPTRRAARDLCALTAVLSAAIPAANALETGDHLLRSLRPGLWPVAGVDLVAAATALAFAATARALSGRIRAAGSPVPRRVEAEVGSPVGVDRAGGGQVPGPRGTPQGLAAGGGARSDR